MSDLNLQLIQEQRLRLGLEERLRSMEAQLGAVVGGVTTVTASSLPGGGQTITTSRVPVSYFHVNFRI